MMLNNYPDTFSLVQIHIYQSAWAEARGEFYGQHSVPTAWFDGSIEIVGAWSISEAYAAYEDAYLAAMSVPCDITLDLTAQQIDGSEFDVTASVCLEPGGTERWVRIYYGAGAGPLARFAELFA